MNTQEMKMWHDALMQQLKIIGATDEQLRLVIKAVEVEMFMRNIPLVDEPEVKPDAKP